MFPLSLSIPLPYERRRGEQKRTAGRAVKTALNFIVVIGDLAGSASLHGPVFEEEKNPPSAY